MPQFIINRNTYRVNIRYRNILELKGIGDKKNGKLPIYPIQPKGTRFCIIGIAADKKILLLFIPDSRINYLQNEHEAEKIAEISGNSRAQIQRYIRLTNLIPALLDMVDEDKIAFRPAVELSYLSQEEQELLLDTIKCEEATPSLAQALKMKQFSKEGKLNADKILEIMCERKPNQAEKITFKAESLRKYIPRSIISPKETEEYILKALAHYRDFLKEGNK